MPRAGDLRILVVDDHRPMRMLVEQSLRELGCAQVLESVDGEDALRVLRQGSFHLVITDFNMPRLDGLGLLRAVRSDPALKALAVIMLTTRAEAHLVRDAMELRVNNYLIKPFSIATLKQKVEAVLGPLT